jgi:NADPH-dependent curcumin reductase CurA
VYDTTETIDLDDVNLAEGEILIKTVALSVDPYMRGRLRPADVPSYAVS